MSDQPAGPTRLMVARNIREYVTITLDLPPEEAVKRAEAMAEDDGDFWNDADLGQCDDPNLSVVVIGGDE